MSDRLQRLKSLINNLNEPDITEKLIKDIERFNDDSLEYQSEEYCNLAIDIFNALSSNAQDTFYALVEEGPLGDGYVPSKTGRDILLDLDLAVKIVVKKEQGYQAATYPAFSIYSVLKEKKIGRFGESHAET